MTIKSLTFTLALAAARQNDPTKYRWYKISKGRIVLDNHHKEFEIELKRGEKFGIRQTKASIFLVDEDDLSIQFKLRPEDLTALMRMSKGFSGTIAGKQVVAGDPSGAAPTAPSGNRRVPREMSREYFEALYKVNAAFHRALAMYVQYGKGDRLPPKTKLQAPLKRAHKAAQAILATGAKLPKNEFSYLEKYYDFASNSLSEVLKKPAPDLLEKSTTFRSLYRFTVREFKEDIKNFAELVSKHEEKPTAGTQRSIKSKQPEAARAVKMLNFLGEKVPSTKNQQRVIAEYLSGKSPKSSPRTSTPKASDSQKPVDLARLPKTRPGAAKALASYLGTEFENNEGDFYGSITPTKAKDLEKSLIAAGWAQRKEQLTRVKSQNGPNGRMRSPWINEFTSTEDKIVIQLGMKNGKSLSGAVVVTKPAKPAKRNSSPVKPKSSTEAPAPTPIVRHTLEEVDAYVNKMKKGNEEIAAHVQRIAWEMRSLKRKSNMITDLIQTNLDDYSVNYSCKVEGTPFDIQVLLSDVIRGKKVVLIRISSSTKRGHFEQRLSGRNAQPQAIVNFITEFFETGGDNVRARRRKLV